MDVDTAVKTIQELSGYADVYKRQVFKGRESSDQKLVGGNYMLQDSFFVLFQKMLFLHLGEKIRFLDLLGEDSDEEVFRGFPDKSITLVDDGLGCGGAHEKTFPDVYKRQVDNGPYHAGAVP